MVRGMNGERNETLLAETSNEQMKGMSGERGDGERDE